MGGNRGGYVNQEATRLAVDYFTILDPAKRIETHIQFLKIIAEEVASIPLYTLVDVSAVRSGLKGIVPDGPGQGWLVDNATVWYWES